ncbi:hypothetical protein [Paractinoplanes maris]|uniref:hypothetical protein n=1 Tax=Paractinoplanes maris TaxID=1734446 RepID=UPI002021187B|nr:hypothetical protein [Actinoplanes maris]
MRIRAALTALMMAGATIAVVTSGTGPAGASARAELVVPTITMVSSSQYSWAATVGIRGRISATPAVPAGSEISVTRTGPGPGAEVTLPALRTGADGSFHWIEPGLQVAGTAIYRVSYAGNDVFAPAAATKTIEITRTTKSLAVHPYIAYGSYNATTQFSIQLGGAPQKPGQVIEVYADPFGADQPPALIKRATVPANGQIFVSLTAVRSVGLTINYLGTEQYAAASRRAWIYTTIPASLTSTRQYKTANLGTVSYAHFRQTVHPYFTTTMSTKPGGRQQLQFEVHSGGQWKKWKNVDASLNSVGKSYYTLTGAHATGVFYRVRAAYLPGISLDNLNYNTYTPYRYFTFTK